MSKGIVLLALGNPQYGRMAANLIASIRSTDKEVGIHLVYSGNSLSHVSEQHKALTTSIQECPVEYYTKNGKEVYLKAKTFLYDLSPFDETIFIDVDLVWFGNKNKFSKMFEALSSVDFTMQNRGYFDLGKSEINEHYSMWCNIKEVKEVYKTTGRFYQLASEFIYFKRSDSNKAYFELVKEIFDNPKVSTVIYSKGKKIADSFAGDVPDELAFDIASCVLKKYPHKDNFVPIYWFATEPKMDMNSILNKYFGFSIGGSAIPLASLNLYTDLSKHYAKGLNVLHYAVTNKRNFLPERKLI